MHTRGIANQIKNAVTAFPVVVIEGGRAVGKTTLCRTLIEQNNWPAMIDLTDPGIIESIRLDPLRYLRELPLPVTIDEAQLLPELMLWVKRVVDDRSGVSGQFILTGSAGLGRDQLGGSDPLAGRSVRFRMWSLTPSERLNNPQPLAAALFGDEFVIGPPSPEWDLTPWLSGGLPGIPGVLGDADKAMWERAMSAYVESVIPLGSTSTRVDHARLLRTFRYLAANTAQQLNFARMSNELAIKAETAKSYLESLESCFLTFRAEAHRPGEHKVLTAHPRVFACDVGLACWASRVLDFAPGPQQIGSLLENQVAHALAASTDWSTDRITLRHWRDQRSKYEVDLLLVHGDGRVVPMEVKASTVVGPQDTTGLVAFAHSNSDSFHRGYLAYGGSRTIDLSPSDLPQRSIIAVPIHRLLLPSGRS